MAYIPTAGFFESSWNFNETAIDDLFEIFRYFRQKNRNLPQNNRLVHHG